jgi:hypothetical protein
MDIIDIYKVLYPTTTQHMFFSETHRILSKIDHILGHKANLNKFNKIEITHWNNNRIKLVPNNKRNHRKYSNTWRLNNTLLNDWWVTNEIRKEIKKFLESNENENTTTQNLWDTAQAMLRWKFISVSTSTEQRLLK